MAAQRAATRRGGLGLLGHSLPWCSSANPAFEISSWQLDVAQTLSIGSGASGAGAGKITFNPFTITRQVDKASPVLFQAAALGTAFEEVILALRKSTGGTQAGVVYLQYVMKLVAVKTISWASGDAAPVETVAFEYGDLQIFYAQQRPDGTLNPPVGAGWNRLTDTSDVSTDPVR